ncbi:MAG: response regulator [Ferruginibacter sp.]
MKKIDTILIIDDDKCTVEIVSLILQNAGYIVICETDGKLQFLKQQIIPDLIILDNSLGEEDGAVICSQLKQTEEVSAVPIIMISATPEVETIALKAGANAFLPKPFSMHQLLKIIEVHLKQKNPIVTG